jgi:hypothetical protein
MALEDVNEKRFSNEEALRVAQSGFAPGPSFEQFSTAVAKVTTGEEWGSLLNRCLAGEALRVYIAVGKRVGEVACAAPAQENETVIINQLRALVFDSEFSGRLKPESEGGMWWIKEEDLPLERLPAGDENRVFEIGTALCRAMLKAKNIDEARSTKEKDPPYSLRDISVMVVRDSLEKQWHVSLEKRATP